MAISMNHHYITGGSPLSNQWHGGSYNRPQQCGSVEVRHKTGHSQCGGLQEQ